MNEKRIVKNIGISMLMKPISILLGMAYTPIALAFLGEAKYGIWTIILNVVSWINYFDIGIGNGLRNKLTEAITLKDEKGAKAYVSTAYLGTMGIAAVFCIVLNAVWNLFDLSTFFRLDAGNENVNLIILISVTFVSVNFVLSLSRTSAYAIQQPGIISVAGVIGQALQLGAVFLASRLMTENLMAIALIFGVVSMADSLIVYWVVTARRPYLRPELSRADRRHMKSLLTLGAGFFLMQISTLVLNTTDNLLISNLYGSAEVTPYDMVYKVFYMLVQIHAIIIMPMWSAYTEAAARRDMAWIRKTMKRVNLITLVFAAGAVAGIFLFEPLAAVWLGKRLEYGQTLIVIVALYMIVQMFSNNYSSLLCGVGNIRVSTIIAIAGAVLNIPLSILFAQTCGMRLSGIILGSLAVMSISFVVLPLVSWKWIRENEKKWGEKHEGSVSEGG